MFGLGFDVLAIIVFVVSCICSFLIGRHFREKRQAKRRERERAAARAAETRQMRRARERRERG